jgi:hypothetical protein
MAVAADLFGIPYLDAESFRAHAELFGVGMAFADYPDSPEGIAKLNRVLQAASRAIDSECCRDFSPADKSETHRLDRQTWRFSVNNPPVSSVVSCLVRYATDGTISINSSRIFVNNQQNYLEITRFNDEGLAMLGAIGTEISEPQIEIVYKSLQDVPRHVRLACGYQAGHLINNGFVDKALPPNFGRLEMEMGDLKINNKKDYRSTEEMKSGSFSAEARHLLAREIKLSVS